MRVGIRDAERLKDSPSSAPVCALGHLPPTGGKALSRSNREGFVLLWDVWIHILGIRAECACWKAGGPGVPPLRRRRGKPGRRVREAAPYKRGGGRTMCAPTWRGGGKLPPHPSGLRPATFPPGGRLGKNKKGQVWNLSLKTKRRNAVSHKISLLTFFFKESKRPRFTTGASYLCVL